MRWRASWDQHDLIYSLLNNVFKLPLWGIGVSEVTVGRYKCPQQRIQKLLFSPWQSKQEGCDCSENTVTELDWKPQLTRRATQHNWLPWGNEKLQCIVCSRRLATHHNDGKDVCKYATWPFVPYLTKFLTYHPELGGVAEYMLVKSNDQSWSLLGKKEKQGINQW